MFYHLSDSSSPRLRRVLLWPLLILLLVAMPALGQGQDTVQIHGFGGWAYGETDGNLYLVGSQDGNYENADFALNLSAHPAERITLVAQVFFQLADPFAGEEDLKVDLDYAFAEIFLSDLAKARIGRVKHPFGIYTEVYNVGTLRPFFTLPQSIYGPQGIVSKAYNGVGFTGARGGGAEGWGFQYDVYGGQLEADLEYPGALSPTAEQDFLKPRVKTTVKVNDMIGARFNVLAPIEGLHFGLSAFEGDSEVQLRAGTQEDPLGVLSETVLGAHVEYVGDRLWARSEWASLDRDDFNYDGYYVEAAYKLTSHWQVAARYEDWSSEVPGIDTSTFPPFFQQLFRHEETALGINYWLTPSAVLRLSYHLAKGNRFAFPEKPDEILNAILTNNLEDETRLIVFGIQFSF